MMFDIVKNALRPIVKKEYCHSNEIIHLINDKLLKNAYVYIIYIDLVNFEEIEECHGDAYVQQFLADFKKIIHEQIRNLLPNGISMIDTFHLWGDDFIAVISGKLVADDDVFKLTTRLEQSLEKIFSTSLPSYFKDYNGIHIGFSRISPPVRQIDKQYYKALKEAHKISKKINHCMPQHIVNEFHDILSNKRIKSVYQPIISLDTGINFGWEALSRGPENSFFHSPSELFAFAEKTDSLFALEKIARELSIQQIGTMQPNQKLFLNVNPTVINDPEFSKGVTRKILNTYNLSPQQIVFEITERTSIQDFTNFRKTINHYRNQGYLIAVDDAGAGYSSLQTIAEIRPDFIKLDMSIIRNVDKDAVKKALLETFATFTQKINCQLIAEGIETASELSEITKAGVQYGQGYYICKPSYPKPEPSIDSIKIIDQVSNKRMKTNWYDEDITAKDLISHIPTVSEKTSIEEITNMFEMQPEVQGVVVLNQYEKPLGFLLKQTLYKILIARYGVSLYYKKQIKEVMNVRPLTVQAETTVDIVAKMAMKREAQHLYDIIIVVDHERFLGIITVQNLLEYLTRIKIEQARYANPLTSLAGNIIIEKEIEQRIFNKSKDVVLYIDIDFFKPYNDTYGFEQGDRFILLISKILKHVIKRKENTFLGHIGGDDFVIICPIKEANTIADRILKIYDRVAKYYYNKADWQAQVLVSTDRLGRSCVYPLSTLSIAGVYIDGMVSSVIQVGEKAANMKKKVKNISGNAYMLE